MVPGDVVPQSDGGERDEDKVQSIQEGPVGLDDVEEEGWEEDREE